MNWSRCSAAARWTSWKSHSCATRSGASRSSVHGKSCMPLDPRDAALLLDMVESARRALSYAQGRAREDLDRDPMLSDAIQRRIEIIGEAARGVSDECRAAHPEIQWRSIMATRHILAHD